MPFRWGQAKRCSPRGTWHSLPVWQPRPDLMLKLLTGRQCRPWASSSSCLTLQIPLHCAALLGRHSFMCPFIHALNIEGNLINGFYALICQWKVMKSWKAVFMSRGFQRGFVSQIWLTCPWWRECHSRDPYSFSRKELPTVSILLPFLWPSVSPQFTSFPDLSSYAYYELEFNIPKAYQTWTQREFEKVAKGL